MIDNEFLQAAIDESKLSIESGSSPFGAVIVQDGRLLPKHIIRL